MTEDRWSEGANAMRREVQELLLEVARVVGPRTQVKLLGHVADRVRQLPVPKEPGA